MRTKQPWPLFADCTDRTRVGYCCPYQPIDFLPRLDPRLDYPIHSFTVHLFMQTGSISIIYNTVVLAHWQREPEPFNPEGWLPVVTLTERYDPEVDLFRHLEK